jgi:hypothetical protein
MYRYVTDDFDLMMKITRILLINGIGFQCSQELNEITWVIELTGAH